ncbi:rRNA-processing protein UTP23 homolog [Solanum pennellii]|uniref:rRNA-processing protein UTP23 homolog n=1 Tax=Solanum pennellii TaxID=28526 RepID=A0ABM1FCV8_SOLPN|nr:rRNA-processing protein UTP23 homolog [Solanum pennellii]
MRVKKQKRHRRAVTFYKACFGFREPFKIFCDGTFVNHVVNNGITPDTALQNILGARVKLFVTRCVLAELKSIDKFEALNAAKNLCIVARCRHDRPKSAEYCITEVIGENNPEHFFVATQDADLRASLQKIPGVPVIFALRNALFLEQPSSFQRQFAKSSEEERLHMTDLEYNMLKQMEKRRLSDGNSSVASEEKIDDVSQAQIIKKNKSDVKDKVRFKRKKAKGPNPLSVLKKKKKPVVTNDKQLNNDEGSVKKKRKRKRRKTSHKEDVVVEGIHQ